jgi:uncharacterized membrane protein
MFETGDFIEMPLVTGAIFLIAGIITYLFPPKKINSFYGYRTSKSMRNHENWTFAQKYSSVKMVQTSLFLLLISCLGFFTTFQHITKNSIAFVSIAIGIVYMFFTIEKALQTKFPNS